MQGELCIAYIVMSIRFLLALTLIPRLTRRNGMALYVGRYLSPFAFYLSPKKALSADSDYNYHETVLIMIPWAAPR